MAVKIRMQRGGATHNPHYRVVVTDVRSRRDGRFVEKVGVYDPKNKDQGKQYALDLERVDYWLSVGAQPSDTVRSLIKRARRQTSGVEVAAAVQEPTVAPVSTSTEPEVPVVEAVAEEPAQAEAVEESVADVDASAAEEEAVEASDPEGSDPEASSEKGA